MLERGMKGYDATLISGFITFILIYLSTYSFETAIAFATYFWVLTIVIFICYHFEIGGDYYRKVKNVAHPKGNKFINLAFSVLGVFFFTFVPLGLIALIFFVISIFI